MSREKERKLRICYLAGIAVLIALGLLSRRVRFVPAACGDALWAMMVYCCFRIVLIRKPMVISAAAALIASFAVEFSQMLKPDWLVKIRSTFLGHMLDLSGTHAAGAGISLERSARIHHRDSRCLRDYCFNQAGSNEEMIQYGSSGKAPKKSSQSVNSGSEDFFNNW